MSEPTGPTPSVDAAGSVRRAEESAPPAASGRSAVEFHQLLRAGPRWGVGWGLLGVATLVVLFVVAQFVATLLVTAVLTLRGESSHHIADALAGKGPATPGFLAVVNGYWALTIPAVWLVLWLVHRVRPGWIESVRRGLRWRWLAWCFLTAAAGLFAAVVVGSFLPGGTDTAGTGGTGGLNDVTATSVQFLLVIVILTPLQAAGEEHAFRGYLTQFFGSLFADRRVARVLAIVAPALLFALAHGIGQGIEIFTDRFLFGLGAGLLVVVTGGLEAGIAMHVLNNFLAFGVALFFGDMTQALNATGGSWWGLVSTAVQLGVWLGLTVPLARRRGIETTTGAGEVAAGSRGGGRRNELVPHRSPV